ncbi:hypothetical protein CBL_05015 [Carabus blaptoides fortunei]
MNNICEKSNEIIEYEHDADYEKNTIIQDILTDIVNVVIGFSEQDVIYTKDYKTEFKTILENLKFAHIHLPKQDVINSLEDQIKDIIDEIKDMDTCIRNDIEKSIADDDSVENISLDGYCIEARAEVMNLTKSEEFNRLPKPNIIDEMSDDEIELQVIDLNAASNNFTEQFEITPFSAGQELDEIHLTKQNSKSVCLEQGDQCKTESKDKNQQQNTSDRNAVESTVINSVLEGKLEMCEKPEKKKKNLGSRLWIFFTKRQHSLNSSSKK